MPAPTESARETDRQILIGPVERRRFEQVEPSSARETDPGAGWGAGGARAGFSVDRGGARTVFEHLE